MSSHENETVICENCDKPATEVLEIGCYQCQLCEEHYKECLEMVEEEEEEPVYTKEFIQFLYETTIKTH